MATCDHLHKRFLSTPTAGLAVLSLADDSSNNPLDFIHKNMDIYLKKLQETPANGKLHEALYTFLCFEYQLKAEDPSKPTNHQSPNSLNNLLHPDESTRESIIDEITILQTVLHLNLEDLNKLSKEVLKSPKNLQNHLENLTNSLCLRQKLKIDDKESQELKEILSSLPLKMTSWFSIIDENNSDDWRSFLSILLELTSVFPESFINFSWALVTGYRPGHPDKRSLTLLCGIIDNLLSSTSRESSSLASINLNFCHNEKILSLISNHIISPVQTCRRESQYVLRRIIEYSRGFPLDVLQKYKDYPLKPPFVTSEDPKLNIEHLKNNFFSLLETLEDKQPDLLLLNDLNNLLESLMDITWTKVLFNLLLSHENPKIITAGVSALLKTEIEDFDDEFMTLLTKSLNHTFLWDNQNSQKPKILRELTAFFINSENNHTNHTSKFINSATKVSWLPIPLFYILEALGNNKTLTEAKYNIWEKQELQSLKIIAENCLKHQTKVMRVFTKKSIFKCIKNYVKSPIDLQTFQEILAIVMNDRFLKRDGVNWEFISIFLKGNFDESKALKFIYDSCKLLKSDEDLKIRSLAFLIVILYDLGSFLFKASVSSNSLAKLFSPLSDFRRNRRDSGFFTALKMINCLMELSPRAKDTYVTTIFGFYKTIFDSIWGGNHYRIPGSYDEAKVCLETIKSIIKLRDLSPDFAESITKTMKIGRWKEKHLFRFSNSNDTPLLKAWYSLNILYWSNTRLVNCPRSIITDEDDRIVSAFHSLVVKIHHRRIKSNENLPKGYYKEVLLPKLKNLAETRSPESIEVITQVLETILRKDRWWNLLETPEVFQDIIRTCWTTLWKIQTPPEFWTCARDFIKFIWSERFLRVPKLRPIALELADDLISRTDTASPMRSLLFRQLNTLNNLDVKLCRQVILSSILQTQSEKTPRIVELQMFQYIMNTYGIWKFPDVFLIGLGAYADVVTRALLVILILRLRLRNEGENYLSRYVAQLISLLQEQKTDDADGQRVKHRVLQVLLLMNLEGDDVRKVHDALSGLIIRGDDSPSVRVMLEWILVKIYLENEEMTDLIWDLFYFVQPENIFSLMFIVYHVAKGLCVRERIVYLKKAVRGILSSCFAGSGVQRQSQVILVLLFELIGGIDPEVLGEYEGIKKAVEENLRRMGVEVKPLEMIKDVCFSFDAVGDFNLQTIFYDVPRLCNVGFEEWIHPDLFNAMLPEYLRDQWFEYGRNGGSLIGMESPGLGDFRDLRLIEAAGSIEEGLRMIPMAMRQQLMMKDTGLIVIASLIEGFPNLGSLARSAENFCARELVLESKRYTENKDFQSLSVTAEKWITVSELKPHELRDYLLEKKSLGWNLVGAEQTANSVNPLDMKFNEKTILLLGNEKNGIPANLIQLMDTCVEIPQAGVVRSLNVHVTGAICMWQYAQQHLF